jgi:hypothetical protein
VSQHRRQDCSQVTIILHEQDGLIGQHKMPPFWEPSLNHRHRTADHFSISSRWSEEMELAKRTVLTCNNDSETQHIASE